MFGAWQTYSPGAEYYPLWKILPEAPTLTIRNVLIFMEAGVGIEPAYTDLQSAA